MTSTKRTTANFALDTNGEKILLLVTRARENYNFGNVLTYEEIRNAVQENRSVTIIRNGYGDESMVSFGLLNARGAYVYSEGNSTYVDGPIYNIGCHNFTLKMFNRILRAAGVRTTKRATEKRFVAVAGL